MDLSALINHFGYAAIFLGAFLEGETVLITAGFLAHRGYLDLSLVLWWAFIGTLAGDQFYFFLGHRHGQPWLERRGLGPAARRVRPWLDRHGNWIIMGFRFLYGLRTVTPFLAGVSHYPALRFILLNGLGALVWTVTVGLAGYLFGQAMEHFLTDVKPYEHAVLCVLLAAGAMVAIWLWRRRHRLAASAGSSPALDPQ